MTDAVFDGSPDRPVRVGVQIQPQHAAYADIRLCEAEEAGVSPRPGRFPEDVSDDAAGAEALYAVGTRLLTVSCGGPRYDLGPLRDVLAWRDDQHPDAL